MKRTRLWEVSDELWERVRPLLPERAPHPKGLCCKNSQGEHDGREASLLAQLRQPLKTGWR
jgi:transposase